MSDLIRRKTSVHDTPKPIALLLLSFCVPVELSLNVGSLNLTMTKLVLLVLSCLLIMRNSPLKKYSHDYTLIGFVFFLFLSLMINHGFLKALESGGLSLLEILVSYFSVRYYITKPSHVYGLFNLMVIIAIIFLPFLIIENFIGVHFIHELSSSVTGIYYPLKYEERLGLTRAYGPFNHPILLGVFFSAMLGMFWYGSINSLKNKIWKSIALVIATFTSLSSAPILIIGIQCFIVFWNKYTAFIRNRWKIIFFVMAWTYGFLLIYSDRSPLMAILSRITIDSQTSYYRTLIWEYGIQNVINNPMFGIGFHDWERLDWMVVRTVDSFWLLTAMRYGLPAICLLSWSIYSLMRKINKLKEVKQLSEYRLLSTGWLVSMIALVLAGFTVDFFGTNMPYFFFLLGLGAAIFKMQVIANRKYKNDQRN